MNDPVRFVVKSRAQENSWLPVPGFSFYWNLGAVRSSCNRRSSFAGSSLRRSGLRRSSLAGCSLRRSRLGLRLAGSGLGRSSNRRGHSLRGRRSSGGRSRTAASSHANSQSQSNNSNSNILEFHIYNLLVSQKISPQRALCTGPVCKTIF